MKVLHVYRTAYPDTQGGLEEVIRQICKGTTRLGCENRVYSMTDTVDPWVAELGHSKIYRVQQHFEIASCNIAFRGWRLFRQLVDWADMVHYHFPWPFADVLHLANRVQKPSIVTYHSDIVRQKQLLKLYRPLMIRFLSSVDRIVATSPNYAASSDVLNHFREKVSVIPIGLDAEGYPAPKEDVMNEIKGSYGEEFLLFIGVLRYYKGLHILLDALNLLKKEGVEPVLVIAGKGAEQNRLQEKAKQYDLKNVHFAGFVTDRQKNALLTQCRALVFPSCYRSEAFGVTLLEAALHGKPMISTELGTGTSWVNQNGKTGYVVPPDNAPALAQRIQTLLNDQALCEKMGQIAKQRFDKHFTGEAMSQAYMGLYQSQVKEC